MAITQFEFRRLSSEFDKLEWSVDRWDPRILRASLGRREVALYGDWSALLEGGFEIVDIALDGNRLSFEQKSDLARQHCLVISDSLYDAICAAIEKANEWERRGSSKSA